jgi:acid phosphatase family membrane protein YuiD
MMSGVSLVVALFTTMPALTGLGPHAAAFAVGITFSAHAVVSALAVRRADGPSVRAIFGSVSGPLLACIPMFLGVRAVHDALGARGLPAVAGLTLEIASGAALYVASALVFAREPSRRLLTVANRVLARRRGG